jgi:hypothetical protein
VVRQRGRTVLDLRTGWADRAHTRPWQRETLALSFSTTKGIASTVIQRLAERGELAYDEPVATYWPEFAAGGKERVTVRHLLTHRAGLWSVRAVAERPEDLLDHLAMEERLAARTVRAPTERSAYHVITYGRLVAGLARRLTGGRGLAASSSAAPMGSSACRCGGASATTTRSGPAGRRRARPGHYGYGGSGGGADPDLGLSLGFVTNRIGSVTTPMADLTLYRLSRIVRECAAARLRAADRGGRRRSPGDSPVRE